MITNVPPKDIQNAIWCQCFGYADFDKVIDGITVRDRIYNTWQMMHLIVKESPEWFINFIKKNEVDYEAIGFEKPKPKQECCEDVSGFYLGTTCPKCNKSFRSVVQKPDLKQLEKQLDEALEKETTESLNEFLAEQRKEHIVDIMRNDEELGLYNESIEEAAKIFCEKTDEEEGEVWSNTYDELPLKMAEFAKSEAAKNYWFNVFKNGNS